MLESVVASGGAGGLAGTGCSAEALGSKDSKPANIVPVGPCAFMFTGNALHDLILVAFGALMGAVAWKRKALLRGVNHGVPKLLLVGYFWWRIGVRVSGPSLFQHKVFGLTNGFSILGAPF